MTSEDSLQYLQRAGGHFIVGRKLKSGEPGVESALARKGLYTEIREHLSAREVTMGNGEKRRKLVLVRNTAEAKRHAPVRRQIAAVIEKVAELNGPKRRAHNDVEQAFRTLKTTLELRPNYHSKDDRIRCHIFLCFLVLVLARIVEYKTGKSWSFVSEELSRLQLGEFLIDHKLVCQLTELTPLQKEIFASMGIKFIRVSPVFLKRKNTPPNQ